MYTYYTNLLIKLDILLAGVSILLFTAIVIYTAARNLTSKLRNKHLLRIKKNLRAPMVPVKEPAHVRMGVDNPEEFLDVETNRESILFTEAERQAVKSFILSSGKIDLMRRLAARSGNKWRRIEAILSLGYAEDSSAVEVIKPGLFNKDEDVSYYSMFALGLIRSSASAGVLIEYIKYDISRGRKIAAILETFPQEQEIADKIIGLTDDKDPLVRYWAVRLAHRFCWKSCPMKIEGLISDRSADVRSAVCEYLGHLGNRQAAKALRTCLTDKVWFVRMKAVTALSKILGAESLPEIAGLINDSSLMVKESVKRVMAEHIEEALPLIYKIFSGTDEVAKREAVEALEISGYVVRLLKGIISDDEKKSADAVKMLGEMVKAHAHLGIESALTKLGKNEQSKILKAVRDKIGASFADHIEKKIKMEISEL